MVRECENLNLFQFGFLWVSMCASALIALVILANAAIASPRLRKRALRCAEIRFAQWLG